jgi:PIN domain nuclease of toxin-antitoxin system
LRGTSIEAGKLALLPEQVEVAEILRDTLDDQVQMSVASPWEIAIKVSLGKLSLPGDIAAFIKRHMLMNTISPRSASLVVTGVATVSLRWLVRQRDRRRPKQPAVGDEHLAWRLR